MITNRVYIPLNEVQLSAIRAQGSGGQNVNKVSSAIHLRFDIPHSSLPDFYKERLLAYKDQRISSEGVIVIKAQNYRDQAKNKGDAINRLVQLIKDATVVEKPRRATKPSKNAKRKRVDKKNQRGQLKKTRGKVGYE